MWAGLITNLASLMWFKSDALVVVDWATALKRSPAFKYYIDIHELCRSSVDMALC